jgi:hypothetical protein
MDGHGNWSHLESLMVAAIIIYGNGCYWHWRLTKNRRTLWSTLARGTGLAVIVVGMPYIMCLAIGTWWFYSETPGFVWYAPFESATNYILSALGAVIAGAGVTIPYVAFRTGLTRRGKTGQ